MELFGYFGIIVTIAGFVLLVLLILMPYFVLQIRNSSEKTAEEVAKLNHGINRLVSVIDTNIGGDQVAPTGGTNHSARCPACEEKFLFAEEFLGTRSTCPSCKARLMLPKSVHPLTRTGRAEFTEKPDILPLPSDPKRPNVRQAKCGQCGKKLTYQVKQTGREVKCPECQVAFTLP